MTLHLLREKWKSLASGAEMTAFQGWGWNQVVESHVLSERVARAGTQFRYVLVSDGEHPVLIAPLRIQRVSWSPGIPRACYFLGHTTSSDYLDFIYRDFRPQAVDLVLDHLRDHYKVATCRFDRILADSPSARHLQNRDGMQTGRGTAVALSLPPSQADYQRLLTKRLRQNVRTALNRAQTDGVGLDIEIGGRMTTHDRQAVRRMRRARAHARARGSARVLTAARAAQRSLLWGPGDTAETLLTLEQAWTVAVRNSSGQLMACVAGLLDERHGVATMRLNLVTHDERFGRYSPGVVGLHTAILHLIDKGPPGQIVDFTRGEERYKLDLGGQPHPFVSITCPL